MARRKAREQAAARKMRAEGSSLREITRTLGVSLSSASTWTRDVELPPAPKPPVLERDDAIRLPEPTVRCGRCKRELPRSCFHKGQSRCRECCRIYMRERGELHVRQTYAARRRRREAARRYLLTLLAKSECTDCGLADPVVLEFDHVGPKGFHISDLVTHGYSLRRIERELEACEVVCVNCHRHRTARRANSWRVNPGRRSGRFVRPRRQRNITYLVDVLERSPCADCGERDIVVLDFDHVGTKRGSVVDLALSEHSIASIEREISQCEIRCANCHKRKTCRTTRNFRHHLLEPP
jgi:hypothetical protein